MTTAHPKPALVCFKKVKSNGLELVRVWLLLVFAGTIDIAAAELPTIFSASAASEITPTNAVVAGTFIANGSPTVCYWQWGTNTSYGNTTPLIPIPSLDAPVNLTATLSPLIPDRIYHFQLVARNDAGSVATMDQRFATLGIIDDQGHVFTYVRDFGIIIMGYSGPGGTVRIPSTLNGVPVIAIGDSVFASLTSLIGVIFPQTLTKLGDSAFANCSALTNITLPNSLASLGSETFSGCTSLQSVNLPPELTGIGDYAFYFCMSLTNLTIPTSVTNIGAGTFGYCVSLTNLTIPGSVTSIADYMCESCTNLLNVSIGNGVTSIGALAFDNCTSLTSVAIPDSVTNIKDGYWIEQGAFSFCTSLTNVTIGNGVTNIGDYGFFGCAKLPSVTIPVSVTSVGFAAFGACGSLTNVIIPDNVAEIRGAPSYLFLSPTLGAFSYCSNLANVTIGRSVTNIGDYTFSGCAELMGVYFRGNAPSVGLDIFTNCNNVTVYYLPETTGWGPTFGGRPTKLWNPQAETGDAMFGVRQNRFGFNITGTPDIPLVIEASTNLAAQSWIPLQSSTLTNGLIYFNDAQWTNYPSRFYRMRSP